MFFLNPSIQGIDFNTIALRLSGTYRIYKWSEVSKNLDNSFIKRGSYATIECISEATHIS